MVLLQATREFPLPAPVFSPAWRLAVLPASHRLDLEKARRLLGWEAKRSWSDYLDENGRTKPDVKGIFSG